MKKELKRIFVLIACLMTSYVEGMNLQTLKEIVTTTKNPFDYDLHFTMLPSTNNDADVLVCMHGMGANYSLCDILRTNPDIHHHILSFNFPDYGINRRQLTQTAFGTWDEIAPALFVLKRSVIDGNLNKIHLYGFSAGGGAIINLLTVLNSTRYDKSLLNLGISSDDKSKILQAIQRGSVILEVPLRSFDEVAGDSGGIPEVRFLAERARKNGMIPIQNLNELQGLILNIFVFFADEDEVLGNRDQEKFIQLLRQVNKNGKTTAIIGKKGGHLAYHPELWQAYKRENSIN